MLTSDSRPEGWVITQRTNSPFTKSFALADRVSDFAMLSRMLTSLAEAASKVKDTLPAETLELIVAEKVGSATFFKRTSASGVEHPSRAIVTALTNSLTLTVPSPLQSPQHWATARCAEVALPSKRTIA